MLSGFRSKARCNEQQESWRSWPCWPLRPSRPKREIASAWPWPGALRSTMSKWAASSGLRLRRWNGDRPPVHSCSIPQSGISRLRRPTGAPPARRDLRSVGAGGGPGQTLRRGRRRVGVEGPARRHGQLHLDARGSRPARHAGIEGGIAGRGETSLPGTARRRHPGGELGVGSAITTGARGSTKLKSAGPRRRTRITPSSPAGTSHE